MNAFLLITLPESGAPLTERLGWCALHFLWQGAGIAVLLAGLLWLCQRGTAELRCTCCGLALILMGAAPVVTWLHLAPVEIPVALSADHLQADGAEPEPAVTVSAESQEDEPVPNLHPRRSPNPFKKQPVINDLLAAPVPVRPSVGWQAWVGLAWLVGVGFMGTIRLGGLGRTLLLVRRASQAGESITLQITRMAARCGLRRAPLVKMTAQLISPAVAGILRPVLLLPAGALAGLSPRELDFILAHEFAHIRRQDFLFGLLQAAVETLLFFHPAVWWVGHRMNLEREHACDDAALRITGDAREGARALARLAELSLQSAPALAPAAGGHHLLHRVRRLLTPASTHRRRHPVALAPLLAAGLLIPLVMLQKAGSQPPAADPGLLKESVPTVLMRGSITDRNGIVLAESSVSTWLRNGVTYRGEKRHYPLGALASHLLGYTKQSLDEVTPEKGMAGLEKLADATLHSVPAKDGKAQPAVTLTIDARFQQICLEALRDGGIGRGTAVILDVSNGDILAMASLPDFDPNQYSPFITDENWKKLNEDETQPLRNRALLPYPPGSTFKLITALAAGASGNWANSYTCTGSVEIDDRHFNCWTVQQHVAGHGLLLLPEALRRSCNCYFYQLGLDTGIAPIAEMARKFGIGQAGSFRLGEPISDFMPDETWWSGQNKGPWTGSKTANVSIGQGEVQATPLQMAGVAATIANHGKIWNPRLITQTFQNHGWSLHPPELLHDLLKEGLPEATLQALRQGMIEVVNAKAGGTGKRAQSSISPMAGKTGTAQKFRTAKGTGERIADNHTQFIGFTPLENPRYAFSIVIANGKSGGGTAAPVAMRIMEKIALMEAGKLTITPSPQVPTPGHFKFLEAVQYADEVSGP